MFGGIVVQNIATPENNKDLNASLLCALDKGIDDMENGRTVPHDNAMKIVRQRLKDYVQNNGNLGSNR